MLIFLYLHKFNYITSKFKIAPKYRWMRLDSNISHQQALTFTKGLNRTDKGVYVCIAENKHGSSVANITMNILCELYSNFFMLLLNRSPSSHRAVLKCWSAIDWLQAMLLTFSLSLSPARNHHQLFQLSHSNAMNCF